ncbi:hypothetical protein [Streptomyces sp. NPDC058612]|uniref:hypothetical protein n=1 Tax=Streptomyces sp. NPDC058612 TaxID=3346555 RepID=UPI003659CEBF
MIADDFTQNLALVLIGEARKHPDSPDGFSLAVMEAVAVEAVSFIHTATGIRPRWPQRAEDADHEQEPHLAVLTAESLRALWLRAVRAERAMASHGQCERDRDAALAALARVHDVVQDLRYRDAVRVLDAIEESSS